VSQARLAPGGLRREQLAAIAALVAIVVLAWLALLAMPAHGAVHGWSAHYFAGMLVMWALMMAAMMLPSAAPMVLFHARISGQRAAPHALSANASFTLGYVAVWALFSVGATSLQWGLSEATLLSPMMQASSKTLAAGLLIAAGLYQWTPLKQSCLTKCRSPLDFVMTHWRNGRWGSFAMGAHHGAYCVGCCWLLMLLLFVGGVMNLAWIAALAAFVLVEKLAPGGRWAGRVAGLALVSWGLLELAMPIAA
jgi:predicted metal-binding membrane protein